MHVTPFSAATILVFATASPSHAQGIEVFGGYSVNACIWLFRYIPTGPRGVLPNGQLHCRHSLRHRSDVSG